MRSLNAIEFAAANAILGGEHLDANDLHIHRTESGKIVSCWALDEDQLIDVVKERCIYLAVYAPTHPPLLLATDFKEGDL